MSLRKLFIASALLAGLHQTHAVSFTVTPGAVSNTYNGFITLQVSNLTAGDTVVVQKYLDLNASGVVTPGDYLVQQFNLTDGQAGMVIGGVTNLNVPGDTDGAANGQITATLSFRNGDFSQNFVGNYLFVLSSPAGHFAPITNSFAVTNFPFGQKITGTVLSNGVPVPAVVILFPPPRAGNHGPGNPQASTVANNSGVYTIQVPTGTYVPLAFKTGCVANYAASPEVTVGSSQTISTNLSLTNATTTISGQIVDANNSSIGLPGVLLPVSTTKSGLIGVGFSDTNGNFSIPVTAGTWGFGNDDSGLIVHGYVGYNGGTNVSAGTSGIVGAFSKGTALFYGTVKDGSGNPVPDVDVQSYDNNMTNNNGGTYDMDGYSDANGNYSVVVVGGLGNNDPWQLTASSSHNATNELYSEPAFDFTQNGTNLAVGQALQVNITAIPVTEQITGNVQFQGTNVAGVGVFASATINGADFNASADTDTNGNYAFSVANGAWSVGVNCSGGSDSLDNILGVGNYQCPNNQNVAVTNSNGTVNFVVQPPGGNPLQINTTSLPNGNFGAGYNFQLQASGGAPPYTWSLANGSLPLPSGLTLGTNGVISGVPTTNGSFNFVVQVMDTSSSFMDQPLDLIINPKPGLSAARYSSGQFQFLLTGGANQNYTLQMSTNLATTNWVTLYVTNNPATNVFLLTDPGATNKQRFYRILVGP